MSQIDQKTVSELVRQVLKDLQVSTPVVVPVVKRNLADENIARWLGHMPSKTIPRGVKLPPLPLTDAKEILKSTGEEKNQIPNAKKPEKLEASLEHSPARLGVWRAGTRYLTRVALKLRADHAIAKDAVAAELKPGFAESHGWTPLETKAKNKEEFLLRPDLGRQLDDKSLQLVKEVGIKNPDIQIIIADGLSAWAAERFGVEMVQELQKLFKQEGFTVGTIFGVKYSRIAIQDVIGEAVGAKLSLILLGERPGLGTGDSLSNYMIFNPKVGAVNASKSMISNIHNAGHKPPEAARLTVNMIKKMFEQGCSGVALKI